MPLHRKSFILTMSMLVTAAVGAECGYAQAEQLPSFYWNEVTLPLDECVQRVGVALTASGFTVQTQTPFIVGTHEQYKAVYFCGTHKGLLSLVVYGPDQAVSSAFLTSITSRFPGRH